MWQKLAPRGWGMGSALAVLPTKIKRGMFLSFFPSVIALLAVVMNINSSEEGTEGSVGLPLTLIRHDVAKTRSSTSVLMKLHGDVAALQAVKGQ